MNIDLVPIYNEDPCPRVVITVTAIPPSGTTVTITRTSARTPDITIREARRVAAFGSLLRTDYEAPFGQPVSYRAVAYSVTGAAVDVVTASVKIVDSQPAEYERAWIQNPLDPKSATEIVFTTDAVQAIEYQRASTIYSPLSAALPVMVGGPVSARGIPIAFYAIGVEHCDQIERLLSESSTQLLRTRDPVHLPRAAYVGMSQFRLVADDFDRDLGARIFTWGGEATLVRPPAANIAVPVFTWDAVKAMYAGKTYDEVKATRPGATYIDWQRDPRP